MLLGLAALGLVVGAVGATIVRDEPGVQVAEFAFTKVALTDAGGDALSWAATIGNPRDDVAEDTMLRLTYLDEDGDVVETGILDVGLVPPGQTVGIGAWTNLRPPLEAVVDMRIEVDGTRVWRSPDDLVELTVEDLTVGYTHDNEPLAGFTVTSDGDEPVYERSAFAVFRDADGDIVGGSAAYRPETYPPLEPGVPSTDVISSGFTLPGIETVEVYVISHRREPHDDR